MAHSATPLPWYADREATVLFYKVNRRLAPQTTLFDEGREDAFGDFVDTLPFGDPVPTGRAFKRTWYLGNRDVGDRVVVGEIGWQRPGQKEATTFDRESKTWRDAVREEEVGGHAPFVYDGETQRLAVLKHPSFPALTLAYVFETLLNKGEQNHPSRAVKWEVQPLLDVVTFRSWLERTRAVQRVTFVAQLPNPDILDEFASLFRRLEERNAAALEETWKARDPRTGLAQIEDDPDARQMIAMAENGYGHINAVGTGEHGKTVFNQKQAILRETTPPLPSTWGAMIGTFVDFALERARRDRR